MSKLHLPAAVRRAVRFHSRSMRACALATGLAGAAPLACAATFPPSIPVESLYRAHGGDGSVGIVVTDNSPQFSGWDTGRSVSSGDINGDGISDLVIGAPYGGPDFDHEPGLGFVVFGSPAGFSAEFKLRSLLPGGGGDGSRGFVLVGAQQIAHTGRSISSAGDVNGDGIDDVIIGAPYVGGGGRFREGASYVVFGSSEPFPAEIPLSSLHPAAGGDGSRGFVMPGVRSSDYSGIGVSSAGDINGDGIDDLIVGAPDAGNVPDGGQCYVVFGTTHFPALLPLTSLFPRDGGDGSHGFVITALRVGDGLCGSLSAGGDVNGDGIGDLVIGGDGADQAYVIFGSRNPFRPVFPVSLLFPGAGGDGSVGFVVNRVHRVDPSTGNGVRGAGDLNGDHIDDLILGADGSEYDGKEAVGIAYVLFGSTQQFPPVFPITDLLPDHGGDGSRGFLLTGATEGEHCGSAVSAAGDINGDGIDDVIVGAPYLSAGPGLRRGRAYVIFGSSEHYPAVTRLESLLPNGGGDGSKGFAITNQQQEVSLGIAVSSAGDVNADGIADVILGAPGRDAAYVILGRPAGP